MPTNRIRRALGAVLAGVLTCGVLAGCGGDEKEPPKGVDQAKLAELAGWKGKGAVAF